MYNEERKTAFIEHYAGTESTARSTKSTFNKVSEFEEKFGCDISEMNDEQVKETVITSFGGSRAKTITARMTVLREYGKWCIESGYKNSNSNLVDIDFYHNDNSEVVRNTMVSSPYHLSVILDRIFCDVDSNSVDNIKRSMIWAAYSGVALNKCVFLRKEHFDFDQMKIFYEDNVYPIYAEAVYAFKNSLNETQLLIDTPTKRGMYKRMYPKVDPGLLCSSYKELKDDLFPRGLSYKYKKLKTTDSDFNFHLKYDNILMSGRFYRMFQLEMMSKPGDFKPDFDYVLRDYLTEERIASRNDVDRRRRNIIRRDYRNDYYRWKDAFI